MGEGEIWVYANGSETSRLVAKALGDGNLLNVVRPVWDKAGFQQSIAPGSPRPMLLMVDLSAQEAWDIIELASESGAAAPIPIIALLDASTEALLDRAYDAGARTYLRKPVTLADFILRAKLLEIGVMIRNRADLPDA